MGFLSWLARHVAEHLPQPPPTRPALDVNSAIQTLLVDAVSAQAQAGQARSQADIDTIKQLTEMKREVMRGAMQALGREGGRSRARKHAEKMADPKACPVCLHDNSRSSRAIIKWHLNAHNGPRPPVAVGGNNEQPRQTPGDSRAEQPSLQPDQRSRKATGSL